MTVMLIPSKKSEWDCITVSFDKKIPQQECKNLINSLVKKNAASVDDENFRGAIVEYFKNVDGGTNLELFNYKSLVSMAKESTQEYYNMRLAMRLECM